MESYQGKSVFGGIAIGRIHVFQKGQQQVTRRRIEDTEAEKKRYRSALEIAKKQLEALYEKALREVGEANAAIFEVHQMMLEDDDFIESVENMIESQSINAEYAVAATGDNFAQMFASMEDEYMRGRAADVKDISERLLNVLGSIGAAADSAGTEGMEDSGAGADAGEPVIIVAEDLAPSETVQMDKDKVLAFVTVQGSVNSHTAILARTMSIPALIGTKLPDMEKLDGKMAVVDGDAGILYLEPEQDALEQFRAKQKAQQESRELLQLLKGKQTVTLDGRTVKLYANIGNSRDLATVLQNDAGGIGLFRSEFLYLEKEDYPTENEQFMVYKMVAETMAGKQVIIRTLDIGADKQCDYFQMDAEANPALGYRAIRICLTRPDVFKTQLRALFRASAFGNIAIMYPMITSVWEVRKIKEIVEEVKAELRAQDVAFGEPQQGIMIETPAAVMVSRELADEVDFFSIGTNDLTQYTLAIDRQNPKLDDFYDAHHPAVLRMIQMVVENAHAGGIWAGICGELGADLELTREFLKMGVDELSVSPGRILPIRKIIRETDCTKLV